MDSGLREILRAHEYNRLNLGCYGCNWSFDDMEDGNSWDQYLAHIESLESQLPKTRGKGMEHFPVPDDDYENWRIGVGLPPQRSMTPEEGAGMTAYRKIVFKRVPARGTDGLEDVLASLEKTRADCAPERSAIFADAAYLVRASLPSHDAALIQKRDREWALVCAEHDIPALADSSGPIKLDSAALRASVREETLDAVIPAIIKWLSENLKWPIMSRLNNSLRKAATAALASEKAAPEVAHASYELGTCDALSEPHGFGYTPRYFHLCSNWRPLPKGDAK